MRYEYGRLTFRGAYDPKGTTRFKLTARICAWFASGCGHGRGYVRERP